MAGFKAPRDRQARAGIGRFPRVGAILGAKLSVLGGAKKGLSRATMPGERWKGAWRGYVGEGIGDWGLGIGGASGEGARLLTIGCPWASLRDSLGPRFNLRGTCGHHACRGAQRGSRHVLLPQHAHGEPGHGTGPCWRLSRYLAVRQCLLESFTPSALTSVCSTRNS